MSDKKLIHVSDLTSIDSDRMNATIAVLSRLFPDAEISREDWTEEDHRETSERIYDKICNDRNLLQLVFTNIVGIHFLVPKVQALQNAPACIISSCQTRGRIQRIANSISLDISNIPSIYSTQTSSIVEGEEELRYSDKVCIALSQLGESHPFYVDPLAYKKLKAQENPAI